jgi:hypothetical protein
MGVSRNPQGPLQHATLVQIGDVVFWDRTLPPLVEALSTDENYYVEMADRSDLLAARKIKTSEWGWIIMERNRSEEDGEIDMRLWPNDFVPGAEIKLPSQVSINQRGISD